MPQTAGLRTFLRGKYAAAKLYQSNQLYTPTDALDIAINPGDLVGVIQKKDPMGNTKRWFVDNGLTQGFLPANILNPIGDDLPVHPYDDVASDVTPHTVRFSPFLSDIFIFPKFEFAALFERVRRCLNVCKQSWKWREIQILPF